MHLSAISPSSPHKQSLPASYPKSPKRQVLHLNSETVKQWNSGTVKQWNSETVERWNNEMREYANAGMREKCIRLHKSRTFREKNARRTMP